MAEELNKLEARAGWLETAKYEDGTPVAYVASIQEFGHGPIPPRPFIRPTVEAKQAEWTAKTAKLLKSATSAKAVMDVMGAVVAGDFREAIAAVVDPPLSPLTLLARKHRKKTGSKVSGGKQLGQIWEKATKDGPPDVSGVSTKPLLDTRIMLNTLTNETVPRET